MSVESRLDPALRSFVDARTVLTPAAIAVARESLNARRRDEAAALDTAGVDICDISVGEVAVRVYRAGPSPSPVVIHCHSGAFVLGNLDVDHRQCVEFARRSECAVIAVDYRLAPEHPYPAALDDVIAVLRWVVANAGELDVVADRIAVSGNSAGGALAAVIAQSAAAGTVPPVVFQLLHQPVLDDRVTASKQEFTATPGFDGPASTLMWAHYLAGSPAQTAVPARAVDLAGVAPAMITCSELDPLRDEALDYAGRLMVAGVATELRVFRGTCHGFDSLAPEWATSRLLFEMQGARLRRALHGV